MVENIGWCTFFEILIVMFIYSKKMKLFNKVQWDIPYRLREYPY